MRTNISAGLIVRRSRRNNIVRIGGVSGPTSIPRYGFQEHSFSGFFSTHKGCDIKCPWGSNGFFAPSNLDSSPGDESESTRFLHRHSNLVDCKFVEARIGD